MAERPVVPLESLREWTTRYAWWSAFWSLTASFAVGYTVPLARDPAMAIVWLPVFVLVGYLVGLVFAFPIALVAAHVLVSFSSLAARPHLLRMVFVFAATALGSAAIISVFSDPVFNLLHWAPALVVANLAAAIGVGRGLGPPPPPRET